MLHPPAFALARAHQPSTSKEVVESKDTEGSPPTSILDEPLRCHRSSLLVSVCMSAGAPRGFDGTPRLRNDLGTESSGTLSLGLQLKTAKCSSVERSKSMDFVNFVDFVGG